MNKPCQGGLAFLVLFFFVAFVQEQEKEIEHPDLKSSRESGPFGNQQSDSQIELSIGSRLYPSNTNPKVEMEMPP